MFADDCMIFARASQAEAIHLKDILHRYEIFSRQMHQLPQIYCNSFEGHAIRLRINSAFYPY